MKSRKRIKSVCLMMTVWALAAWVTTAALAASETAGALPTRQAAVAQEGATPAAQPGTPAAQPPSAEFSSPDVEALLEPIRAKHEIPGMIGAIVKGEAAGRIGAVGVRRLGSPQKMTLLDKVHIGSDTKAMTATLLAMFVEQGKIKWGTTIAEVFPELGEKIHADYRGVTLEQLLTHRGGVPTDLSANGLWAKLWAHGGTPTEQRRTLLEGVVTVPPAVKPGEKFMYANAGYAIAGHMAETLAGKPWESLMQEKLFGPLGMTSAGFGAPGDAKLVDQPWGHAGKKGNLTPMPPGKMADNPAAIGPGGTVHCSVPDWAKFVGQHIIGERGESKLLKGETFTRLHAPAAGQEYACGWGVAQRPWGGRVLTHAGSNTMWYCVAWVSPEKNFAVLVACNCAHEEAAQACDEAAAGLIQLHLGGK